MKVLNICIVVVLSALMLTAGASAQQMIHFEAGETVYAMEQDPYTGNIWVVTGEFENEKIKVYDAETKEKVQEIIDLTAVNDYYRDAMWGYSTGLMKQIIFDETDIFFLREKRVIRYSREEKRFYYSEEFYKKIRERENFYIEYFFSMSLIQNHVYVSMGRFNIPFEDGGILKLNRNNFSVEERYISRDMNDWPAGLGNCYEILHDPARNQLWVATDNGLYLFNLNTKKWTAMDALWNRELQYPDDEWKEFHSVRWNADSTKVLATHFRGMNSALLEIDPVSHEVEEMIIHHGRNIANPLESGNDNLYYGFLAYGMGGAYRYVEAEADGYQFVYHYYNENWYQLDQRNGKIYWHMFDFFEGSQNPYDMGGVTSLIEIDGHIWAGTLNGVFVFPDPDHAQTSVVSEPERTLPTEITLFQNYPNPFNSTTTIEYVFPTAQRASVGVYDISGRLIARLADAHHTAGRHRLSWSPSADNNSTHSVSSGIYIIRVETASGNASRRVVYVK